MKIMILTSRCGMGHYKAAMNLQRKLKRACPSYDIESVDIYEEKYKNKAALFYKSYDYLVHHASKVYNYFYSHGVQENSRSKRDLLLSKTLYKGFPDFIRQEEPDLVVSTFSLTSVLFSIYKEENQSSIPLVTWITDIQPHTAWVNPGTDLYIAASEATKRGLLAMGVEEGKILIGGVPVADSFSGSSPEKRMEEGDLLMMGGGLGLLPSKKAVYRRLSKIKSHRVTVVTGKNRKLYRQLRREFPALRILGYVDNIGQLMRQSSLLLTKAGGLTLFEAVASEVPMAVFQPSLEQEKANADFIREEGIGLVLPGPENNARENIEKLEALLNNEEELQEMEENIKRLHQSLLDQEAIRRILSLL